MNILTYNGKKLVDCVEVKVCPWVSGDDGKVIDYYLLSQYNKNYGWHVTGLLLRQNGNGLERVKLSKKFKTEEEAEENLLSFAKSDCPTLFFYNDKQEIDNIKALKSSKTDLKVSQSLDVIVGS